MKGIYAQELESILHMLVNYGEESSYEQRIPAEFATMCNNLDCTPRMGTEFIRAELVKEVVLHQKEYLQTGDQELTVVKADRDLLYIVTSWIRLLDSLNVKSGKLPLGATIKYIG